MRIVYTRNTFRNALWRAIASVVIGIVLIACPEDALKFIVMTVGALFLLSGLVAFFTSWRRHTEEGNSGLVSLNGIGSVVLGVLLISTPLFFTAVLMVLLGFVLLAVAAGQLTLLAAARQYGQVPFVSYLFPVLVMIAGMLVVFRPGWSAENLTVILGVAAVFNGVTDLISQRRVRGMWRQWESEHHTLDTNHPVEDTTYEEVKD